LPLSARVASQRGPGERADGPDAPPSGPDAPPSGPDGRPGGSLAVGYSGTPLHRKLGIKPGHAVAVLGAPPGFAAGLASAAGTDMTEGLPGTGPLDVIVTFVRWREELETQLPGLRSRMAPACGLWIAWPKRSAKLPTDMTEHVVREVALPTGLVDNKVCAIDQAWSGLRLVIRRELR
jgi:hypothetical protein